MFTVTNGSKPNMFLNSGTDMRHPRKCQLWNFIEHLIDWKFGTESEKKKEGKKKMLREVLTAGDWPDVGKCGPCEL